MELLGQLQAGDLDISLGINNRTADVRSNKYGWAGNKINWFRYPQIT